MHLKNNSLYSPDNESFTLTPAYDLLSTKLFIPEDTEELALTLYGKKKKLKREFFVAAMTDSGLQPKVIARIFSKYEKELPKMRQLIAESFIPAELQTRFIEIIETNLDVVLFDKVRPQRGKV